MSKLVYLKDLMPDSVIHFSWRGEKWKLRSYAHHSAGAFLSYETSELSVGDIKRMAKQPPNLWFDDTPAVSYRDVAFWKDEIAKRNRQHKIGQGEEQALETSLQPDAPPIHEKKEDMGFSKQEIEIIQLYRNLSVGEQANVIRMLQGKHE